MAISGKLAPDCKLRQVQKKVAIFELPCLFKSKKVQKNITFYAKKGVNITVFQRKLKISWLRFLEFHILRTFSNRLLIHYYHPILLCFDTFLYAERKIKEAELLQTPVHDIMTSFLATNCPDPELRLELLGSDYVSLNGMVNRALNYEQAQSFFKKPTEEVNAVQAKKCSQYQQG